MCVGGGSRWAPCCLLPATQGLLQEIPALQHFLHTPRGPETSPDVVFPASAPVAQHRDNGRSARGARRERRPAPFSHPRQEKTVGKERTRTQQSLMAPDFHRTNLPHRRGTKREQPARRELLVFALGEEGDTPRQSTAPKTQLQTLPKHP